MSGHGLEIVALNLCLVPAGLGVLALAGHRGRWRPGLAYMTGIAAVGIVLTLLLVAGAGLEVWQFLLVCGLFAVPALRGPWPRLARPSRPPLPALIGIALVVGFLALLAVDAANQPLWSFDSWSLWTDKAKGIVLLGGLDPTFVRGTVSADYPLLVPALEAVDLRAVGMDTVAVHMQFWCFAAGTVWALADLLRERVRPVVLWCLLPALVVAPAVGIQTASALADVPLGCFVALTGVSALLWLWTGALAHLVLAGLFAAAGVATKTEGALYAAAIAAALLPLALRHSRRSALAVGVVCAAVLVTALPWSVWSIRHHLASWYSGATDLGAAPAHVHVSRAFVAAPHVAREIADPTSWLLLAPIALGAIVLAWRAGRRDECVLAAVPPVIAFAGFVWIYWHTPYDLHVHLANSARRVIIGIDLYLAALAPLLVETALRRGEVTSRPVRVSFIVPAYNEAATIAEVLERVDRLGFDRQIVVVDDGSTDDTPRILEEWATRDGIVVVRQENRGKGAAIRAAIPYLDGEIVVIQDADMEYDPVDVPQLIEPIERGAADVVYGSRLSGGRPQRAYMFWHLVGNRFLSLVTNLLFNTTLSDMETGYKAFRVDVLRSLELREDDFAIEPEITGQVCKLKFRIYELPIAYYGRTYAEGKKITWRDGFKALRTLVRVRLER